MSECHREQFLRALDPKEKPWAGNPSPSVESFNDWCSLRHQPTVCPLYGAHLATEEDGVIFEGVELKQWLSDTEGEVRLALCEAVVSASYCRYFAK